MRGFRQLRFVANAAGIGNELTHAQFAGKQSIATDQPLAKELSVAPIVGKKVRSVQRGEGEQCPLCNIRIYEQMLDQFRSHSGNRCR
ncbi:hypothetical protein [Ochrobactrum sp. BTU1]|uniref:hypothetical protein n=1 Tax=Ochrobactrum sp. BTU1 TaxID=2840456 RepID=UPI001C05AB34|nr:hypothetical protein KMS41_20635 [Ochrobactrum sp. BTU1]